MSAPLLLAHAGHWLESVAMLTPVVLLPAVIALFVRHERRRGSARH